MLFHLLNAFSEKIKTPFLIKLPDAKEVRFGTTYGTPAFQIVVHNQKGLRALKSGLELNICEAYIDKDIDVDGSVDMLKLLEITQLFFKQHPFFVRMKKYLDYFRTQVSINKKSIEKHYEFDDAFYLYFLDKTRAYSHGVFLNDEESLEVANNRKLEFALQSCQLKEGAKIFDLGSGWGCAIEYFGSKNMHVDGVTISEHSRQFISTMINDKQLNHCKISKIDFLDYKPSTLHQYDAILSLGTLEHLPNYAQVLEKCSDLLRAGGYAYFDASATDSTESINSYFIDKYIFPGNHKCLNIYEFVDAVKNSDFELVSLHNDTHNYFLTLKGWAQNLDNHKEEIINRWGEALYRKFQLYFWGCCYGMGKNELQAYRIVLRKKM